MFDMKGDHEHILGRIKQELTSTEARLPDPG